MYLYEEKVHLYTEEAEAGEQVLLEYKSQFSLKTLFQQNVYTSILHVTEKLRYGTIICGVRNNRAWILCIRLLLSLTAG